MSNRVAQIEIRVRPFLSLTLALMVSACAGSDSRDGEGMPADAESTRADSGAPVVESDPSTAGADPSDPGSTANGAPVDAPDTMDMPDAMGTPDSKVPGAGGAPIGETDTDGPYTGRYGQPISIGLPYLGKEWGLKDGTLIHVESSDAPARFVIEYVRATATSNSNAQYDARIEGTVYLRDVFRLRVMGTDQHVYFDPTSRRFKVDSTSEPAQFLLTNKYGSNIEKVDTDAYCKGVYDSFEYYEDPNNRNVVCEFPYADCYGRCAFRKLFLVQGDAYKVVGLSAKAKSPHVTIDGITGYQYYEYRLP